MGSILNLLNPLSSPSPHKIMSPKNNNKETEGEEGQIDHQDGNDLVTPDAEAEFLDPARLRAIGKAGASRPDITTTESQEAHVQADDLKSLETRHERQKPFLPQNNDIVHAPEHSIAKDMGESSRRTSASSLADILNPVEESQAHTAGVPSKPSSPGNKSIEVEAIHPRSLEPMQLELPHTEPAPVSDNVSTMAPEGSAESDEKMVVDVIGLDVDGTSVSFQSRPETVTKDSISMELDSHPMEQSKSTDSERTTTDIINDPIPTTTESPLDSRAPDFFKKRKYSPESSPDEPLLQTQSMPTIQVETEIQNQIAVQKPQAAPKASKKPKKIPIKKPQAAKKKQQPSGSRKPSRSIKRKEEMVGVGIDDVRSP